MAILVSDVVTRMRRVGLDAEGADYYDDTRDMIPAVDSALTWLINVIDGALGQNKITEEVFEELTVARVWQTDNFSRINPTRAGIVNVDNILAVIPLPVVYPLPVTITTPADDFDSVYRSDLTHVRDTVGSAKRLNIEQWATNRQNPLEAGQEEQRCIIVYAYLNHTDYSSNPTNFDIEIRPFLAAQLVTIVFRDRHAALTQLSDTIRFNARLFNMLYEKALINVTRKQADETTIYGVSQKDIDTLAHVLKLG